MKAKVLSAGTCRYTPHTCFQARAHFLPRFIGTFQNPYSYWQFTDLQRYVCITDPQFATFATQIAAKVVMWNCAHLEFLALEPWCGPNSPQVH
eukprot:COSAG05_NODE_49_length_24373_cov_16.162561_24_plen_93_part_00